MALSAPVAHAADAFGGKPKEDPSKELLERMGRLEQQLTDLATKQAAQAAAAATQAPGSLNLPAPPGAPPEPPVGDEDLKLDFEVKGELNGKVLVKKGNRIVQMDRAEFERFSAQAKTRARQAAFAPVASPVTPPPANTLGTPPAPPAAPAPEPMTASKTVRRAQAAEEKAMATTAPQPMPGPAPVKK